MNNSEQCGKIGTSKKKFYCPKCGWQTLFMVSPDTEVKKLFIWCRTCKKEVEVNISSSHCRKA